MMRPHGIALAALLALALPSAGALAAVSPPAAAQSGSSAAAHPYAPHVADAARRFGIPEAWIWAVMRVESRGNSRAISRAGAMGVMQIMPATWAALRARHGLGADPFDVRDNIMAGAAYLRAMHDRYGNVAAMLAAYNAGPGRYDQYLRGRPLPGETRAYLAQLAPLIGGASDVQLAAATPPADPLAWRRAALFVRTGATGATGEGPGATASPSAADDAAGAAERADAAQRERAPTAAEIAAPSQADSLFIRRTSAAVPQ